MSEGVSAPRDWPPVDLIAGLALETTAEPQGELDEEVYFSKDLPSLYTTLPDKVEWPRLVKFTNNWLAFML